MKTLSRIATSLGLFAALLVVAGGSLMAADNCCDPCCGGACHCPCCQK